MAHDPNYLHRMICLAALRELGLADVCHEEMLPKNLLPTITQLSADAVPNVRFKVSRFSPPLPPFLFINALGFMQTLIEALSPAPKVGGNQKVFIWVNSLCITCILPTNDPTTLPSLP